jgi:hypothetical protein
MFMFDVESLGVESTSAVLSVAVIKFDLKDEYPEISDINQKYLKYVEKSFFVKFVVEEQLKKMKRSVTKSTMEWWNEQEKYCRDLSFVPDPKLDVLADEGIQRIHYYCFGENPDTKSIKESIFWQRGGLDQLIFDSLCRSTGKEPIIPYNCWYDLRTMINLTKNSARSGYCNIPGFDRSLVKKHDPMHDCAYDILMMIHGE